MNDTEENVAGFAVSGFNSLFDNLRQGNIAGFVALDNLAAALAHYDDMVILVNDLHGVWLC